ncbi:MAG TPA: hypothetical protein VIP29_05655 [Nitrososphaeraceae archaeon]
MHTGHRLEYLGGNRALDWEPLPDTIEHGITIADDGDPQSESKSSEDIYSRYPEVRISVCLVTPFVSFHVQRSHY